MELLKHRRMVEDDSKNNSQSSEDKVDVVRPPPGMAERQEVPRNDRTKCREWNTHEEEESIVVSSPLVRDQLSDTNGEAQLRCQSEADENLRHDQGRDVLSDSAQDTAQKCNGIATDEEPFPTKHIAQRSPDQSTSRCC